jgi:hypothetical protein
MAVAAETDAYVRPARTTATLGALAVAGMASIGAGAIHATAVGAHSEHRQAMVLFVVVACLQIGWGALALVRSRPRVAWTGVALGAAMVAGWALAKARGISAIDGLGDPEPVQAADALAALLAGLSMLAALVVALSPRPRGWSASGSIVCGLAVTALTVPGMVAAGGHTHAEGHTHADSELAVGASSDALPTATHTHSHTDAAATADTSVAGSTATHSHTDATVTPDTTVAGSAPTTTVAPAVVPPVPYDPARPIDLGGVPGVTPEEQARAENLVAITLARLPRFADPATAVALGYYSIGDGITGFEHYVNRSLIDDDKILDPDYPESLVYQVARGQDPKLVSAMFMLPEGTTLDDVPDIGGALTQWHIHDDLCFSDDPTAPRVAGVTSVGGTCPPPLKKFAPVPMIHVWITKNACGPFAALEGVGAGQVKPGETHLCDHAHGSH